MAYRVEFLKTAEEELAGLPKDAQRQIVRRIEALKDQPRPAGVEQLKGAERLLRLRVGDYRVAYTVERTQVVVVIVRIGHRKEVYANLEPLVRRLSVWRQQHKK